MNIQATLAKLSLEEKASLCSGLDFWMLKGIERVGIPSIMVTDGPHGLRKQASDSGSIGLADSVPATCFPTASALASTWNRELIFQVGQALGEECRQEDVGVILGPGVNIKRSPLCGRNFEYFSEDPYLSGEIAKRHINGVQSQGIGTSLKHFAVNNQEYRRMTIDAIVDERTLREIYLPGYEIAVKEAQPWTVMCGYNRLNGTYCCENPLLMTDILKNEWGHEGVVITDWGAMNQRVEALKAGTELEMPGTNNGNDAMIVAAVQEGRLSEDVLDQAVERILAMIFKAQETLSESFRYDAQAHHALARQVAGEGAVLLKNEAALLPLEADAKIALLGEFAKKPRIQGAGSSLINPSRLDNVYDEMVKLSDGEKISYAPGYPSSGDEVDESLLQEAISVAKSADVVVVCAGLPDIFEVEGLDREHMRLPRAHDALIDAVSKIHSKVVVVLSNGSPVEMPWEGKVQTILEGYLGGQAGGGALADILYGQVNPSGKLAETFPSRLEDNPSYHYFPGGPKTVEYREGLYVGYRYYDTVGQDVLYPFGHGLSYTSFEYSDLQLNREELTDKDRLTISLTVKNSGSIEGKEIVQLYVKDVESTAFRPDKELKGFVKINLSPGEETVVSFELNERAFSYYNVDLKAWHVESGEFEILVGASSQDIRLSARVQMESTGPETPLVDRKGVAVYYDMPKGTPISRESFENLLERPIPNNEIPKGEPHTLNTPISDMQDSLVGRLLGRFMQRQVNAFIKGEEDSPTAVLFAAIVHEAPLRLMLMTGGGAVNREMLDALLMMINGKIFKGVFSLVRAIRNK